MALDDQKGIAGNIEAGLNHGLEIQLEHGSKLDARPAIHPDPADAMVAGPRPELADDGRDHLLGYNEPDKADQANMAIGDAIVAGSARDRTAPRAPAVSDGGRDGWLYPFIDQADAAGLRVDYVPVHYYWCASPVSDPAAAANQFYNFLKATYDRVKRPLWITEWNNGANWTGCGDPTAAQQQAAIGAMTAMLDSTPFVERYAPYNWVEDVRRLKWDDGSLTAAGTTYRDRVSPIGYVQTLPEQRTRSFSQLRFENDLRTVPATPTTASPLAARLHQWRHRTGARVRRRYDDCRHPAAKRGDRQRVHFCGLDLLGRRRELAAHL